jgi:hypothetical protein
MGKKIWLLGVFIFFVWNSRNTEAFSLDKHSKITIKSYKKAGLGSKLGQKALLIGVTLPDIPCTGIETACADWSLLIPSVCLAAITHCPLSVARLYHSHWGNKQYWHAMTKSNQTNNQVREKIIKQLVAWWESAMSRKTQKIPTSSAFMFVGKIIHTIQDSYSKAHVHRNRQFKVLFFQNYAKQSSKKHSKADNVPMSDKGVKQAIQWSSGVINLFKKLKHRSEKGWYRREFKKYLSDIFRMVKGAGGRQAGGTHPDFSK